MVVGHLDFNSCYAQNIPVGDSKVKNGNVPQKESPILSASRATKERLAQDSSSCILDDDKITLNKKQFRQLLEMAISNTKAEQKKEHREKREAEMRLSNQSRSSFVSTHVSM